MCTICKGGYHLIHNTTNCLEDAKAFDLGYYLNDTFNEFEKCDQACKNCNRSSSGSETNCLECNTENGYYYMDEGPTSNCYNNETIPARYFLNIKLDPIKWIKCDEKCATCGFLDNSNNITCLKCRNDLFNDKGERIKLRLISGNCYDGCPDGFLLSIPDDDCVENCSNGTYEFSVNKTCLEQCPEDYKVNKLGKTCISTDLSKINLTITNLKSVVSQDLEIFTNPEKIIKANDFQAEILDVNDLDIDRHLESGISSIDFGDCISRLRQKYNMSRSQKLIIITIANSLIIYH